MANELIHVLANHAGPFHDLKLPYHPNFQPLALSPEQEQLHKALRLDDRTTDYYLAGYVATLQAFPDILAYLNVDSSCDSSRMYVPPLRIIGATVPRGSDATSYRAHASDPTSVTSTWPLNLRYQLHYQSASTIKLLARDTGMETLLGYTLGGEAPRQYLRVQWTPDLPFNFELLLETAWGANSVVDISLWPQAFPAAAIVNAALQLTTTMHTLEQIDMLEEYHAAVEPCEKLAILLLAMVAHRETLFIGATA